MTTLHKFLTVIVPSNPSLLKAHRYADLAHSDINQKRKYSGDPYIVHPERVAYGVFLSGGNDNEIMAAFLHDVPEDTQKTLNDILMEFGIVVAMIVAGVTKTTTSRDGTREQRQTIELENLSKSPSSSKKVKFEDIKDNVYDLHIDNPKFCKIYLPEKLKQIEVLFEKKHISQYNETKAMLNERMRLLGLQ
jgi:(p)ppGpp synthase/HD superfamily hydrolase